MLNTLIVTDSSHNLNLSSIKTIEFASYLADYPKANEPKTLVINLCAADKHLSQGYYCSLLAEARQHKVIPTIKILNDFDVDNNQSKKAQMHKEVLLPISLWRDCNIEDQQVAWLFFGRCENQSIKKIAKHLFDLYPSPILKIVFDVENNSITARVTQLDLSHVDEAQSPFFIESLLDFTKKTWRGNRPKRQSRWNMAILHNPDEKTPPSDSKALSFFIKAAEKVGIQAELVTPKETSALGSYDALFIRETTAINHHTYKLARKYEREGLIVMDDATSILRCCNKVFLHDAFTYNKVPAPKSRFVSENSDETCDSLIESFGFPMVLKLPESSFSIGVYKVDNLPALKIKLAEMLQQSALILVQEFLYTDYDWRIGVLNGKAIYACRYFMARNHWQIYNHSSKKHFTGNFETLPTFEVPKNILDAAVKASKVAGNGLYGVDLKCIDNKVYVIEVNDNPSLESKVEDQYLGIELYILIMQEFANRLEARGR